MKYRLLIASLLGLLVASTSLAAQDLDVQVLVLRDGSVKTVRTWTRDGALVRITALEGNLYSVRADDVDFEKSRLATIKARVPKPTPTPTPKEKSLVEISRELQRKRDGRPKEHGEVERGDDVPEVAEPPRNAPHNAPVAATPGVGAAVSSPVEAASPTPATPTPATPTPLVSLTPAPTPTQVAAQPSETPASTTSENEGSSVGVLPFAIGGLLLVGVGAGLFILKRRRGDASDDDAVDDEGEDEELFAPAFADETAQDDELAASFSDEMLDVPDELPPPRETLALPESTSAPAPKPSSAAPPMFAHGQELQIRIGADVYSCPDLATLSGWVAEGRVIENSEVLSPEGTWLMAGSIPDLEAAFEERRQNLGY